MKGFNWNKINTKLKIFNLIKDYAQKHNFEVLWSEVNIDNRDNKEYAIIAFVKKDLYNEFDEYRWQEGINWFPNKFIRRSNNKLIFRNI